MLKLINSNNQVTDVFGSFEEYQDYTGSEKFTSIIFDDLLFDEESITLAYNDIKSITLQDDDITSIIINSAGLCYKAIDILVKVL